MSANAATAVAVSEPAPRRGVVLVNVGTPDAPTPAAVRRYLREFLGDPYVIDLPAPARWLLLNAVILPFRPKRSAHAYRAIWTEQGSPLLLNSVKQRDALAKLLPEAEVVLAMRYGNPSLAAALAELKEKNITEVTLVPLYPQRAGATTGTTVEAATKLAEGLELTVVPAFFSEKGFIDALAQRLREVVLAHDLHHVVFSYHGLPVRQVKPSCGAGCGGHAGGSEPCPALSAQNADCYRAQCYATSEALASAAGTPGHTTSFQSRLKGATWLHPFTDETLVMLAQRGLERVAVACPAFVADCLETLEEIGMRARETFITAGGKELVLVPAVNDHPLFINALAGLVRRHWSTP